VLRHFLQCVLWFLPPSRLFWLRRALLRLGGVGLEPGVGYCGRGWVYGRGTLRIGRNSWLSPGVVVYTHLDAPVAIGRDCDIGPEVSLVTGSHEFGGARRRAGVGTARPIVVEDGCWIGARVVILGGVTIGRAAFVAAGSVVTKDVPPASFVAGVPAVVKRRFEE
jgi:maltose O-acetyltransferase